MFVASLWPKTSYRAVNRSREFFQLQTVTSIWTSPINRVTTTTCWTHGNIGLARDEKTEFRCWERCAGSEFIWKCRPRQYKRYVKSKTECEQCVQCTAWRFYFTSYWRVRVRRFLPFVDSLWNDIKSSTSSPSPSPNPCLQNFHLPC